MKINKTFIFTTLIAPIFVGILVDVFTKVKVWKLVSDSIVSLWNVFCTVFTWIYENIVWFEIPLWTLVIAVLFLKQAMKYKNNFSTKVEQEVKHSLTQVYSEFDEHTRMLFNYFITQMNRGARTAAYELSRYGEQNNLSKLEIEALANDMINENILEAHYNFIEETHFTLSSYGKKIAVAIIKQSKVGNKTKEEQ